METPLAQPGLSRLVTSPSFTDMFHPQDGSQSNTSDLFPSVLSGMTSGMGMGMGSSLGLSLATPNLSSLGSYTGLSPYHAIELPQVSPFGGTPVGMIENPAVSEHTISPSDGQTGSQSQNNSQKSEQNDSQDSAQDSGQNCDQNNSPSDEAMKDSTTPASNPSDVTTTITAKDTVPEEAVHVTTTTTSVSPKQGQNTQGQTTQTIQIDPSMVQWIQLAKALQQISPSLLSANNFFSSDPQVKLLPLQAKDQAKDTVATTTTSPAAAALFEAQPMWRQMMHMAQQQQRITAMTASHTGHAVRTLDCTNGNCMIHHKPRLMQAWNEFIEKNPLVVSTSPRGRGRPPKPKHPERLPCTSLCALCMEAGVNPAQRCDFQLQQHLWTDHHLMLYPCFGCHHTWYLISNMSLLEHLYRQHYVPEWRAKNGMTAGQTAPNPGQAIVGQVAPGQTAGQTASQGASPGQSTGADNNPSQASQQTSQTNQTSPNLKLPRPPDINDAIFCRQYCGKMCESFDELERHVWLHEGVPGQFNNEKSSGSPKSKKSKSQNQDEDEDDDEDSQGTEDDDEEDEASCPPTNSLSYDAGLVAQGMVRRAEGMAAEGVAEGLATRGVAGVRQGIVRHGVRQSLVGHSSSSGHSSGHSVRHTGRTGHSSPVKLMTPMTLSIPMTPMTPMTQSVLPMLPMPFGPHIKDLRHEQNKKRKRSLPLGRRRRHRMSHSSHASSHNSLSVHSEQQQRHQHEEQQQVDANHSKRPLIKEEILAGAQAASAMDGLMPTLKPEVKTISRPSVTKASPYGPPAPSTNMAMPGLVPSQLVTSIALNSAAFALANRETSKTEYWEIVRVPDEQTHVYGVIRHMLERFESQVYKTDKWIDRQPVAREIKDLFEDKKTQTVVSSVFSKHLHDRYGVRVTEEDTLKPGLFVALHLRSLPFTYALRCNLHPTMKLLDLLISKTEEFTRDVLEQQEQQLEDEYYEGEDLVV